MIANLLNRSKQFAQDYHPIVHSLLVGTILARAASSMSLPFLAIYLTKHTELGAGMIGLIIGAGSLAATVGGFVGGALSDQFGRRKIMLAALFGWTVVFLGFALSKSAALFFVFSLLNGLCRSFYEPVSQALMADLTPKERRMSVFSLRYLAINIGVSVGPLLGALFAAMGSTLPFIITSAIYFIYLCSLYSLLNRFGIKQIEGEQKAGSSFSMAWEAVKRDYVLRYYLIGGIVTAIGYSQMTVTLSQFVENKFAEGVTLFAVMMSVNAITVVALQIPVSRWMEKFSVIGALTLGVSLYALGNVGFAFSVGWISFIVSMIVFTLGEIITYPAGSMLVDGIAPEGMRGSYYGAQSFSNLGHFIGPWIGGILLSRFSGSVLFTTMAFVAMSAILFYRAGEHARLSAAAKSAVLQAIRKDKAIS
ncbi:putative MFS family arabinose efflux permease [Paenibacillus taihuensis]|uniref:Putative MFS family arabinose efflux permease n=1 Tax=Paenibacillus taihuensis TaxID=1156355 RepID=A0A3D9S6F2_9BACL|nr:MFS transporter [Paenibacillus taihuensis]REE88578.1 putative MFS family arabinose efflux permease [Paenibacillus taihuensis]